MKEDYLWDKTGTDPAIEKLESALRVFSAAEAPLPVLPVEATSAKRTFFSGLVPFAFAAACIAIAALAWGVWMQFAKAPVEDQRAAGTQPSDAHPAPPAAKPEPPYIKDTVLPAERPAPKHFVRVAGRQKPRKSNTVLSTIPAETTKPKFTAEEIYAYNQLMLALTITSDKLGQVRDKAIGED